MITSIGILYITLAFIFLCVPIIFIELGRPRDLIKGGICIFLGVFILIQENLLRYYDLVILSTLTLLSLFFVFEIFAIRWNQLGDKEKNKFRNFSEYLKILSFLNDKFYSILLKLKGLIDNKKTVKKKTTQKKWIRSDDKEKVTPVAKENFINSKVTSKAKNQTEEDIIDSEENLA